MPCSYYTPEEERRMAEQQAAEYKRELDRATRLLCGVMTNLVPHEHNRLTASVPGLSEWWAEHQRMDAERIAANRGGDR